jgi:hypothetical protein
MGKTLHFQTAEGKIVDLVVDEPGTRSWGSPGNTFSAVFDDLRAYAESLAATIDKIKIKPAQVEVSLGMKLTGETGAVMAVFVKGGLDADLSVKLTWKNAGKGGQGTGD